MIGTGHLSRGGVMGVTLVATGLAAGLPWASPAVPTGLLCPWLR
ncbi:hypothetical protein [Pyrodictium delaneyi]|nr:hypothetical protein [Pyrodictium delaneyi]